MSVQLRLAILLAILLYFICVISLLQVKKLQLRYSLLWLLSGVIMLIMDAFPSLLNWFARIFGIEVPVNGLFAVTLFCLVLIIMSLTSVISKDSEKLTRLSQEVGMLDKKVRELEEKISEK